jgi:hypothetical protein
MHKIFTMSTNFLKMSGDFALVALNVPTNVQWIFEEILKDDIRGKTDVKLEKLIEQLKQYEPNLKVYLELERDFSGSNHIDAEVIPERDELILTQYY